MTLFEWKITDLGDGEYGYIWISVDGKDTFGNIYRVFIDPYDRQAILGCTYIDGNMRSNIADAMEAHEEPCCEWHHPATYYGRILHYWRSLGCPRIDRKAPGYDAPWFPWLQAGFTDEERDNIIAEPSEVMTEELE
jgi:hypothetical protein